MIPLPPLYPITDARSDLPLSAQIRRFGAAGFPLVQFRGKPLDARAQWGELRRALEESRERGGWPLVVLNDRADLAVLAAQEGLAPWGLHLGQEDLPASEAARLPGLASLRFGASTHGPEEWGPLDPAFDHAGVGPVRGTATKADHAAPIGFPGLAAGCAALEARGVAPVAIGGLVLEDLPAAFLAGAESVAMVSAIADGDPSEALWAAQVARWRARPPLRRGRGVVLAGSSGAGKSTLGAALARVLGLPFVDLDRLIQSETGRSIPELFAAEGEAAFRALEIRHAARALDHPAVLALGGGAWESEAVRAAAEAAGALPLWLAEPPELCWARVTGDPRRPLAQEKSVFMARHAQRMSNWCRLPCAMGLGRPATEFAEALAAGID